MKLYTATGDKGTTSLIGGQRVSKYDERVEAYGAVDELGAFAALLGDRMRSDDRLADLVADIEAVSRDLMTVEALLASDGSSKDITLDVSRIAWLESRTDALQAEVPEIRTFTIPGGCETASLCHVCRTVCRRAERQAVRAASLHDNIRHEACVYLNRLSDYLYIAGRAVTTRLGATELQWRP